jgi:sulfur-carrier protein adenylyltransferase/sulfurtransferase
MFGIKQLFKPIESLETDDVKKFVENHPEGSYTLLDVRQPGEYEGEHLPGSKLIPLPELIDRKHEIDPEKPVLVY